MAHDDPWHVKLRRARTHLDEVNAAVLRYQLQPLPYRTTYKINRRRTRYGITVRANVEFFSDVEFPAIVGDLIFNLRCALDYLICALSGDDDRQFPIYVEDVWTPDLDPASGKDRNTHRRRRFEQLREGGLDDSSYELPETLERMNEYVGTIVDDLEAFL